MGIEDLYKILKKIVFYLYIKSEVRSIYEICNSICN